jgi:hypothetical protein
MEQQVAFSISMSSEDGAELKQQLDKAFEGSAITLTNRAEPWQFEGPPEGSFGFGDGLLVFFGEAWRDLCKVPGAILAVAEGIKEYLKNRPNATIKICKSDGTVIFINGNMSGNDIGETLKQI